MPLALQLVTRPVRVAGLVALAAAVAFLSAATVLGAHRTVVVTAVAALAASGTAIGALAPLYGRGAAIGLWTTRAGSPWARARSCSSTGATRRHCASARYSRSWPACASSPEGRGASGTCPRGRASRSQSVSPRSSLRPVWAEASSSVSPGSPSSERSTRRSSRRRRRSPEPLPIAQVQMPQKPRRGGAVRPPCLTDHRQLRGRGPNVEAARPPRAFLQGDVSDRPGVGPAQRGRR